MLDTDLPLESAHFQRDNNVQVFNVHLTQLRQRMSIYDAVLCF